MIVECLYGLAKVHALTTVAVVQLCIPIDPLPEEPVEYVWIARYAGQIIPMPMTDDNETSVAFPAEMGKRLKVLGYQCLKGTTECWEDPPPFLLRSSEDWDLAPPPDGDGVVGGPDFSAFRQLSIDETVGGPEFSDFRRTFGKHLCRSGPLAGLYVKKASDCAAPP